MKRTSILSAFIAASTIVCQANFLQAGDHFNRKKSLRPQVIVPTPDADCPPENQPQYTPSQPGQITPSLQSQSPAPVVSPSDSGSNVSPVPNLTSNDFPPPGDFASVRSSDFSGLGADDRRSSPLSGPLNTIGDFFAPGGAALGSVGTNGRIDFDPSGRTTGYGPFTADSTINGQPFIDNAAEYTYTQGFYNVNTGYFGPDSLSVATTPSFDSTYESTLTSPQYYGPGRVVLQTPIAQSDPSFVNFIHFGQSSGLLIAAPGSQLGRFKLAEQNSPLPRDRVFLDYSFFNNARVATSPRDVQRFAPGFEKTFFDKLCSVEVRVPMGVTLNSTQIDGSLDANKAELGNLGFAFKGLLIDRGSFLMTTGLAIQTPTANDNILLRTNGSEAIRVVNQQVRILPYLATLHTNGDWMWQNWVSIDAAANGNEVRFDGQSAGKLQEQNYFYADSSLSRWMYRNYQAGTGWALTGEVHYNGTVGSADTIQMNGFTAGTPGFDADIVNLTFGSTYVYGKTTLTTAYGTPVTKDRGFDGELRVLINRFF